MNKKLTEQNYMDAANELGCELAVIKTVTEVESAGSGFIDEVRPKILFEAHIFSKLTNHAYDFSHPKISSRRWNRRLYIGGKAEYDRLEEAKKLDEAAALQSCSWGLFQIMGFNYKICGYNNVFDFVNDMYKSENEHLKAFIQFIKNNNLSKLLKYKNWREFSRRYNGPSGVRFYLPRLTQAYNKWIGKIA